MCGEGCEQVIKKEQSCEGPHQSRAHTAELLLQLPFLPPLPTPPVYRNWREIYSLCFRVESWRKNIATIHKVNVAFKQTNPVTDRETDRATVRQTERAEQAEQRSDKHWKPKLTVTTGWMWTIRHSEARRWGQAECVKLSRWWCRRVVVIVVVVVSRLQVECSKKIDISGYVTQRLLWGFGWENTHTSD